MAKHAESGDIRLIIDPSTLLIATLILTAVGLVSVMIPAIRAPASIPSKRYATSKPLDAVHGLKPRHPQFRPQV